MECALDAPLRLISCRARASPTPSCHRARACARPVRIAACPAPCGASPHPPTRSRLGTPRRPPRQRRRASSCWRAVAGARRWLHGVARRRRRTGCRLRRLPDARALADAGATLTDVISTRVLVASEARADLLAAWEVVRAAFADHPVPSTLLGVTALCYDGQLVEIEAIAAAIDGAAAPSSPPLAARDDAQRTVRWDAPSTHRSRSSRAATTGCPAQAAPSGSCTRSITAMTLPAGSVVHAMSGPCPPPRTMPRSSWRNPS